EAEELASGLGGTARPAGIVRHSGGNPFLIGELVRSADSQVGLPHNPAPDAPTLGDLVRLRLFSRLPEAHWAIACPRTSPRLSRTAGYGNAEMMGYRASKGASGSSG